MLQNTENFISCKAQEKMVGKPHIIPSKTQQKVFEKHGAANRYCVSV
jgi:hypothetical protein